MMMLSFIYSKNKTPTKFLLPAITSDPEMCDNRQIFKLKQTFLFRQILDTQKIVWGEPSYVIRLPERHILDLNLKKVPLARKKQTK
jgi:hypothetical protein